MTAAQARAEVFWTAFVAMNREERRAFLQRLVADPRLREDLFDAALIEERRGEPTRPLQDVLTGPESRRPERSR